MKYSLPPFDPSKPLRLELFPNGGWTISQHHGDHMMCDPLGAFSNAADMVEALSAALLTPTTDSDPTTGP